MRRIIAATPTARPRCAVYTSSMSSTSSAGNSSSISSSCDDRCICTHHRAYSSSSNSSAPLPLASLPDCKTVIPKTGGYCRHHSISTKAVGVHRTLSSLPTPTENSLPQNNQPDDPYANLQPIDFTTASQISGEESQILEVQLLPNQMLRAESGAMLYMTEGVEMETSMGLGGPKTGSDSGLSAGFTRMMTGQNLMVSDFTYTGQKGGGTVGLGTDFPAKILKFSLEEYPDAKLVCQKGAFLAGSHTIAMEMAYTKSFTGGFFGGEGFILQSLRGTTAYEDNNAGETVFLKAYGTVVKKELKAGETLRVSSGSLVCMTSTVDFDVTTMPGFKNVMFGGEGLFVTTLSGPGTVWLQGMPVDRMVSEIARHIPSGGGIGLGIPIMGGGGGGDGAGDATDAAAGDMAAGDASAAAAGGIDADGVPVTDAAVDADRNATVASSGMESPSSDPDSSESLFGDAAYGGGDAPPTTSSTTETTSDFDNSDDSSFYSDEFSQPDTNMPGFEEPTMEEQQFEDDGTTFSTYEGDSVEGGEGAELPTMDEDEGPSLLGQLWDLFKDFTDDD